MVNIYNVGKNWVLGIASVFRWLTWKPWLLDTEEIKTWTVHYFIWFEGLALHTAFSFRGDWNSLLINTWSTIQGVKLKSTSPVFQHSHFLHLYAQFSSRGANGSKSWASGKWCTATNTELRLHFREEVVGWGLPNEVKRDDEFKSAFLDGSHSLMWTLSQRVLTFSLS